MRVQFINSVLASSLATVGLGMIMSSPVAAPSSQDATKQIGFVKLPEPLPFTPQEMAEPFGFKLRLTENKDARETVMRDFFGNHIFTFYYNEEGHIMMIYSPLARNDSDLCYALGVLKDEKPAIYRYLETSFQASQHCLSPQP